MGFSERIELIVDVVADRAASGLSGLKSKVGEAEGAFGKLKAAGSGAFDLIGSAGPLAVAGAAAAVAKFAADGIQEFQNTALAAGKFADATGLGVEASSRWLEVSKDIGVSGGTVEGAFVKMEKAISTNRTAFGDLVKTGKNGAVDLNATFLAVIQHIQGIRDPIDRANESSKLFGKGFKEVAEVIGMDADQLKKRLEDVGKAQVITQSELEQAREYRDSMAELKDATEGVKISLGQELAGSVATAAKGLTDLVNLVNQLPEALSSSILGGGLGNIGKALTDVFGGGVEGIGKVKGALDGLDLSKLKAGIVDAGGFGESLKGAETAARNFGGSADAISQNLGIEADAAKRADDSIRGYSNAVLEASGSALGVSAAQREFNKSMADTAELIKGGKASTDELSASYDHQVASAEATAQATVAVAEKQAALTGAQLSGADTNAILIGSLYKSAGQMNGPSRDAVIALIGQLNTYAGLHPDPPIDANTADADRKLKDTKKNVEDIPTSHTVNVNVNANTASAARSLNNIIRAENAVNGTNIALVPGGASGFKNFRGGVALVGEEGPELVNLPKGADVIPAPQTERMIGTPGGLPLGGGATIINFHGPVLGDKASIGRWIDEALAASRRRGNRAG